MYAVSDAFKTAMKQPVQSFRLQGYIGKTKITEDNVLAGSLTITNQCSGDSSVDIGQVYVGELSGTFMDTGIARRSWKGLVINLMAGIRLADGSYEDIPLTPYTISTADWSASGVVVKAYDNMQKFDKALSASITSAPAFDLLTLACTNCGMTLSNTEDEIHSMANGTRNLELAAGSDISTWRDLISWVAQTLCANATIDRDGKLRLFQYGTTVVDTLDPEHRFSGASFSDFYTYYTGLSSVDQSSGMTKYVNITPDDGLTYNLGTNPFLQGGTESSRGAMRKAILDDLTKIRYVPFSCEAIGSPAYDLGDCLKFVDGLADNDLCCITKFTWTYNSKYQMSGSGSDPELSGAQSKSDKNISGLIASSSADTAFRMAFINGMKVDVGENKDTSIILCAYRMSSSTFVVFHAVCDLLISTVEGGSEEEGWTETDADATFTFYIDKVKVADYTVGQCWQDGMHNTAFLYSLIKQEAGIHTFEIYLNIAGGTGHIDPQAVRVVIDSTGLRARSSYIYITGDPKTQYLTGESYTSAGITVMYYNGKDMSTVDVTDKAVFKQEDGTDASTIKYQDVGTYPISVYYTNDDGDELSTEYGTFVSGLTLESEPSNSFYTSDLWAPVGLSIGFEDGGDLG